jgi:hypothetical protein
MFSRSGHVCAVLWKAVNCNRIDWFRQSCPAAENVANGVDLVSGMALATGNCS